MWNGSVGSIPAGWVLCNGSSGTPDLRSRFVVGAGSTYAVNATGGSADATLVSHNHTFSGSTDSVGDHNHSMPGSSTSSGGSGAFENRNPSGTKQTGDAGGHNHGFSGTTSSNGSSATNANLPPYFALCYIMKL